MRLVRSDLTSLISIDEVDKFKCGISKIDKYFHENAYDNEASYFSCTSCVMDVDRKNERKVIGMYTLAPTVIEIALNEQAKKGNVKLPEQYQEVQGLQIPAIELKYFGIDKKEQGKKYGRKILTLIFRDLVDLRLNLNIGFAGMYVNALSGATDFYENLSFEYLTKNKSGQYLETEKMFINFDNIIELALFE